MLVLSLLYCDRLFQSTPVRACLSTDVFISGDAGADAPPPLEAENEAAANGWLRGDDRQAIAALLKSLPAGSPAHMLFQESAARTAWGVRAEHACRVSSHRIARQC